MRSRNAETREITQEEHVKQNANEPIEEDQDGQRKHDAAEMKFFDLKEKRENDPTSLQHPQTNPIQTSHLNGERSLKKIILKWSYIRTKNKPLMILDSLKIFTIERH